MTTLAVAAKHLGQAQAAAGAPTWRVQARAAAMDLASRGTFTSEDLTNIVGFPVGRNKRDCNNAIGSLFSELARAEQIEWTGEVVQCTREESHASDLRVWQAYTGLAKRRAAVLALVEKYMVPGESVNGLGTTLTLAEQRSKFFTRQLREVWES